MIAPVSSGRQDGRSSFRRLSQYILESIDPLTNERVLRGEFFIPEVLQNFDEEPEEAIKIAAAIMRVTAAQNLNTPDPIFHYQLCLQPGETMSSEQFRDSVMHSLAGLMYIYRDENGNEREGSYADHQFVAGKHTDKEHTHAHVMVNRVHPERLTAHTPQFYMRSLDKSCRELEHKHGWKESPGLSEWDCGLNRAVPVPEKVLEQRREAKLKNRRGAEGKAALVEYHEDEESVLNKVRRTAAKPLRELCARPETRWKDVHALLAKHGYDLHKSDMGGYTVEDVRSGVRVKASKALRVMYHKKSDEPGIPGAFCGKKNRQATEERLGPWEPMSAELRAGILKTPIIRSREPWAQQTGGYSELTNDDQKAASAAFTTWQQELGAHAPEMKVEGFVANVQNAAVRRADKDAKREEPAVWNRDNSKAPKWTQQTRGYDALSPELKKDAERDFSAWATKNPDAVRRYSIAQYVSFRQQRAAEKSVARKITSERRDDNRARRAEDRRTLANDFQKYRKSCIEDLGKHAKEAKDRSEALKESTKKRKKAIREDRATLWAIRRVQLQQVDREFGEASRALCEGNAIERASMKPLRREQWVAAQAEAGDERAIRQLRGWRYQSARNRNAAEHESVQHPSLSAGEPSVDSTATLAMVQISRLREENEKRQKEISAAFQKFSYRLDRKTGDVWISIDGKTAAVDRGSLVNVVADTEAARVLALEMAIDKFGSRLTASGSEEWKRSVALTVARNRMNVTFVDDAMNELVRDKRERLEAEHSTVFAAAVAAREPVKLGKVNTTPEIQPADQLRLSRIQHLQNQLTAGQAHFESLDERDTALLVAAGLSESGKNASGQVKRAANLLLDFWPKSQLSPPPGAHDVTKLISVTPVGDGKERRWRVAIRSGATTELTSGLQRLTDVINDSVARGRKANNQAQSRADNSQGR